MDVKDSLVFKQIAPILGEDVAEKQLRKVLETKKCHYSPNRFSSAGLQDAFFWGFTPQGHGFWDCLYNLINAFDVVREEEAKLKSFLLKPLD